MIYRASFYVVVAVLLAMLTSGVGLMSPRKLIRTNPGWGAPSPAALAADNGQDNSSDANSNGDSCDSGDNGNSSDSNSNGSDSNSNSSNSNSDDNTNASVFGPDTINAKLIAAADNCDDNSNGSETCPSPPPPPPPAPRAAPPPPAARQPQDQGPCYFQLGFLFLHQLLNGLDGDCTELEHPDPNGTGDQVQATSRAGVPGLMVWQKFTNTMRWTDGGTTVTFSKCGLQYRPALRTFNWERNPNLLAGEGPPPLGACDLT
jgi:hypothetical protein